MNMICITDLMVCDSPVERERSINIPMLFEYAPSDITSTYQISAVRGLARSSRAETAKAGSRSIALFSTPAAKEKNTLR